MQLLTKKTSTLLATATIVGFSSLFLVATPASAAQADCTGGGVYIGNNICELVFTTPGTIATFTPTPLMSQLEVLLVGGGGSGLSAEQGYGSGPAGGGGHVRVVGFGNNTAEPIDVVAGYPGQPSFVEQGATTFGANGGLTPTDSTTNAGGESGSGNAGSTNPSGGNGGGGAGASPASQYDGGAGVIVANIAPVGSLFSGDTSCYGGGGAAGVHLGTIGTATCGGGSVVAGTSNVTPVAPAANSGGGGAGGGLNVDSALRQGAAGRVVIRWLAPVTVGFASNGHGAAVASQTMMAGVAATRPADPTAAGYRFNGWFTDAALTSRADFSVPFAESVTLYASWSSLLPDTGAAINPAAIPLGLTGLGLGIGLVVFAARRTRDAH